MLIDVLVLNHNGARLLEECLPSVVRAAQTSRHTCRVAVVDNSSTDDSLALLAAEFPQVEIIRCANRGLCSFNEVLAARNCRAAVLLNNDIKLDAGALDPLIQPLLSSGRGEVPCFLTAPLCWLFDGTTYEGQKTSVQWRWGLVQATSLFPGHEAVIDRPDLTASAGAAIAVDREKFLALGGFDLLYLPGRLEDLDLCFRGYMRGWHARYVPAAVAYHRGAATFARTFDEAEIQRLALRNTLLFQWKNLRHPLHVARAAFGLAVRLVRDAIVAPRVPPPQRLLTWRALREAWRRRREVEVRIAHKDWRREREYFRRFAPQRLLAARSVRRIVVRASRPQPACAVR